MVRRTKGRARKHRKSRGSLTRGTQRIIRRVGRPVYRGVKRINKPIQRKTGELMHIAVKDSARVLNRVPGLTLKNGRKRRRRKRTMRGGGIFGLLAAGLGLKKVFGRDPKAMPKRKPFSMSDNNIHVHMPPGKTLDALTNHNTAVTGGARKTRRRRRRR